MTGKFVSFEGIDGSGKTSHLEPLAQALRANGHTVVVTREPGGIPMAETLRSLLLNENMDPVAETLLMFAARKEHIERVIRPALDRGDTVLCDRFTDSSFAYQGGGKGVDCYLLFQLEKAVQSYSNGVLQPDLTLWFDLDPVIAAKRRQSVRVADKFEAEDLAFFTRVATAYAMRMSQSNGRMLRIDAADPLEAVWFSVLRAVEKKGLIERSIA